MLPYNYTFTKSLKIYVLLSPNCLGTENRNNRGTDTLDYSSFQGPAQLFIACNTEKRGDPSWYAFPREHYVIDKWPKFSEQKSEVSLNQLHVQCLVCMTVAPRKPDTCDKLPGTLALLSVLSTSSPTFN